MLVIRSLFRAQLLRRQFSAWHREKFDEQASLSDYNEFVDGWYILMLGKTLKFGSTSLLAILVSDVFVIIGTCLKLDVQTRQLPSVDDFQISCIFLGLSALLCYSGILRYLGYFRGYNILGRIQKKDTNFNFHPMLTCNLLKKDASTELLSMKKS